MQKNMSQIKEKGKNLQDQINEEEIGNLSEKEFRGEDTGGENTVWRKKLSQF